MEKKKFVLCDIATSCTIFYKWIKKKTYDAHQLSRINYAVNIDYLFEDMAYTNNIITI